MLNFDNFVDMYCYIESETHTDALCVIVKWQKKDWLFHGYMQKGLGPLPELEPVVTSMGWGNSELQCSCEALGHHFEIRNIGKVVRVFIYDWLRYRTFQARVVNVTDRLVKFELI